MKNDNRELFIDYSIRHVWHKISRMYNQHATDYNLSMSVGFILLAIDKEGTPSTQLGPKMGMESTSLSRTLKLMEDNKLIYRQPDEFDKRKVLIFLSPSGIEMRKDAKKLVVDFNEKVAKKLTKKQLETFFIIMDTMEEIVDGELQNTLLTAGKSAGKNEK